MKEGGVGLVLDYQPVYSRSTADHFLIFLLECFFYLFLDFCFIQDF